MARAGGCEKDLHGVRVRAGGGCGRRQRREWEERAAVRGRGGPVSKSGSGWCSGGGDAEGVQFCARAEGIGR